MMTNEQCAAKLYDVRFTAGFNQRYHQICEWRYGIADKSVRIAVGVLAIASLVATAMRGGWLADHSLGVSVIALIAAIILNVIPLGEREKFHGELFHRWTDLRKDAELQLVRVDAAKEMDVADDHICERLRELIARCNDIDAQEPAPFRKLLRRCEDDERESEWGVRTTKEVERERKKRLASKASAVAGN